MRSSQLLSKTELCQVKEFISVEINKCVTDLIKTSMHGLGDLLCRVLLFVFKPAYIYI